MPHTAENERNPMAQDEGAVLDVNHESESDEDYVNEDDFSQEQDESKDEDDEEDQEQDEDMDNEPKERRPRKKASDLRSKVSRKQRMREDPAGTKKYFSRRNPAKHGGSNDEKSSPSSQRSAQRSSGRSSKQTKTGRNRAPATHRTLQKNDSNHVVLTHLGKLKVQSFARAVSSIESIMYENYQYGIRTMYPTGTYQSGLGRDDPKFGRYVFTNKEKLEMLAEHRKLYMAAFDVMEEIWMREDPDAIGAKTTQTRGLSRSTPGTNGADYSVQQRLGKLLCMAQEVGHNILSYKFAPLCQYANRQKTPNNAHLFEPKQQKWGDESLRFHGYAPQQHGTGDKHYVQMLSRVYCDDDGYIDENRIFQHCRALCNTEDESKCAQDRLAIRKAKRQMATQSSSAPISNDQSHFAMPLTVQIVKPMLPVIQPSVLNDASALSAGQSNAIVTATPVVAISTLADQLPTCTPYSSGSFSCDTTVSVLHSDVKNVLAVEDPMQDDPENPLKRKCNDMLEHEQFVDDCMVLEQASKWPTMNHLKSIKVKIEEPEPFSSLDMMMRQAIQPFVTTSFSVPMHDESMLSAMEPVQPMVAAAGSTSSQATPSLDKREFLM